MNRKITFYNIGRLILLEAVLLLLPLLTAVIYKEKSGIQAFLIAAGAALLVGGAMTLFLRPKSEEDRRMYAREGFAIVALAWIAMSAIGALPFFLSGEIPSYIDAFFETVSGFTTTGASVLTNVEALSHGMLFWRSFTHWIGGMGVLVLMMALLPSGGRDADSGRSIHIMRAEMPGPIVGKLVPRVKETAKILYLIYILMTAVQVLLLCAGGMPFFESLLHTFGTAGTGGFGLKCDSITSYSPYLQWVIAVFMLLFGINFNLYYMLLLKNVKGVLQNAELWCYLAVSAASTLVISANIYPLSGDLGKAFRDAFFQVASITTTTGYATADFNLWPMLSKAILFLLMFMGGCAGSTAGGLKVSRLVLLFRTARRDLTHILHPRSVGVVHLDGKKVDEETLNSLSTYCALYFALLLVTFLLLCIEPFDFETNLTAAVSCVNNVGPAFGAAGPASSYAAYSGFAKLVLSMAMLLGRLEIIPVLFTLSPSTWKRK